MSENPQDFPMAPKFLFYSFGFNCFSVLTESFYRARICSRDKNLQTSQRYFSLETTGRAGLLKLFQLCAFPFPYPKIFCTHAALKWLVNESSCRGEGQGLCSLSWVSTAGSKGLRAQSLPLQHPQAGPGEGKGCSPHRTFQQLLCQPPHESDCCWRKFCSNEKGIVRAIKIISCFIIQAIPRMPVSCISVSGT